MGNKQQFRKIAADGPNLAPRSRSIHLSSTQPASDVNKPTTGLGVGAGKGSGKQSSMGESRQPIVFCQTDKRPIVLDRKLLRHVQGRKAICKCARDRAV